MIMIKEYSAEDPGNISGNDDNKPGLLRHVLNFTPALLIMILIMLLTFQAAKASGELSAHTQGWLRLWLGKYFPAVLNDMHILRSSAHIFLYAPLGATVYYAFIHYTSRLKATFCAVIVSSVFGLMDEAVKIFLPGREFDFWDWLIDVAGSFSGAFIALLFALIFSRNRAKKFPLTVS